jgi:hypothetical protein
VRHNGKRLNYLYINQPPWEIVLYQSTDMWKENSGLKIKYTDFLQLSGEKSSKQPCNSTL